MGGFLAAERRVANARVVGTPVFDERRNHLGHGTDRFCRPAMAGRTFVCDQYLEPDQRAIDAKVQRLGNAIGSCLLPCGVHLGHPIIDQQGRASASSNLESVACAHRILANGVGGAIGIRGGLLDISAFQIRAKAR